MKRCIHGNLSRHVAILFRKSCITDSVAAVVCHLGLLCKQAMNKDCCFLSNMCKKIVGTPSIDALVRKPDLLSFHVASKIPVSESTRQELLEIDGILYRLRREIELLENFDRIRCKSCQTLIASRSDMLVMSNEGPLGAYVNPSGFVHEIMTLLKASGLALVGRPSEEYSWFPGYAWTIALCATCECQMGWLFTATHKKLKPHSFWGIRSSQVADNMC